VSVLCLLSVCEGLCILCRLILMNKVLSNTQELSDLLTFGEINVRYLAE